MKDEILTFFADTEILKDEKIFKYFYNKMPPYRKEKINAVRFSRDKRLSLGVGILLSRKADGEVLLGENGKPYFKSGTPEFSLSHSGTKVFAAFSSGAVGCDVEKIREVKENIAERYFFGSEFADISARTGEEKIKTFFKYWTLKESFMKITGRGFSLPLNEFSVNLGKNITVTQTVDNNEYYFRTYDFFDGYIYSVCGIFNNFAPPQEVKFEDLIM